MGKDFRQEMEVGVMVIMAALEIIVGSLVGRIVKMVEMEDMMAVSPAKDLVDKIIILHIMIML